MASCSTRNQLLALVFLVGMMEHFHRVASHGAGTRMTCVQCTPADPRCESGNLEPTECQPGYNYCARYRVFVGGSQGVFRGCTRNWLSGCRQKEIEKQESMICYFTCSWDGCNRGRGTVL